MQDFTGDSAIAEGRKNKQVPLLACSLPEAGEGWGEFVPYMG